MWTFWVLRDPKCPPSLCSTATVNVPDCVLYYIKTMTTVVISLYSDNGLDFFMYLDGLYCCATVWLLMGGKLCSKCVFLFVCTVNGSKTVLWKNGPEALLSWQSQYHICVIHRVEETDVSLLWSLTHTHKHTHNPGGDVCVQTVFKRNCLRHRDVSNFSALCKVSGCSHMQHQARREAMSDFYFEIMSLLSKRWRRTFTL